MLLAFDTLGNVEGSITTVKQHQTCPTFSLDPDQAVT